MELDVFISLLSIWTKFSQKLDLKNLKTLITTERFRIESKKKICVVFGFKEFFLNLNENLINKRI